MVAEASTCRHDLWPMIKTRLSLLAAAAVTVLAAAPFATAQVQPAGNTRPMAVPVVTAVPDPQDVAYPGTIALEIDASDLATGAFRVTETIPVAAGATRLTLLYPEWLPGNHGPRGPLPQLAGVRFYAGDTLLTWTRDPVDVYAFHVDVPAGARQLDLAFKFLSATEEDPVSYTHLTLPTICSV